MTEYDIGAAFQAIENKLIQSMVRNMERHRAEETSMGIEWSMWQAEQLKALEKYKRENQKRYGKQFSNINGEVGELIRQARQTGNMQQEIRILQAIRKGFKVRGKNKAPSHKAMSAEFFRLNDRKLESLIKATTYDMEKAETAILRMANDRYRKAIFNAQVYANSGAGTYEKAVDMANKDMLSSGLNCIEYKNGARHTLPDYAEMAIRTASKRAYLHGEGEKRQEWGISTVIVNKRGNPCPRCLPFVGKVLIDDVWSGGTKSDGPYPLMSTAIAAGLYHPRCKDSHTTYFPGISIADDKWTKREVEAIDRNYQKGQKQQYAARQADKFGRLEECALDLENRKQYMQKKKAWEDKVLANNSPSDILDVVEEIYKSVGAKSKNYDVFNPVTGEIVNLAEGTRITQPKNHIMAGKGRERQIDCIDWLVEQFGGQPEDWTKEKGFGYMLDEYGEERLVELHWYQNPEVGKVEMKIKLHDGREYIDKD